MKTLKAVWFILLLSLFFSKGLYGQNQANLWYWSQYCGIDFNSGIPVYHDQTIIASGNAMSVMCDTNGNLLFCCSGIQVKNREGHTMPNGENLIGFEAACMGALIVQQPGSDHLYYVFTVGREWPYNIGMHYSVVDMHLDGGLGDVTSEKNVLLAQAWAASNKLTSVRHANGEDIWIITRNFKSDQYYIAFLLTSSGLSTEGVVSPVQWRDEFNNYGNMKISYDKKYLAAAYVSYKIENGAYTQCIDICSFNASSGEIDLLFTISKNPNNWTPQYPPWAVEFSPDSKLLYATFFNEQTNIMELYQYDIQYVEDSTQFKQSETFIAQGPVNGLQLARDGKIYCTGYMPTEYGYVSVIHEPWKRGAACHYQANAIYLNGTTTDWFFPNMLLDHLYRFEWEGECARHPIVFQPNFIPEPSTIVWNFGDGETSSALWPVHEYNDGGEYEVSVLVNYPSGRVEETSRVITILDGPNPDLGPDQLICEGDEIELTAGNEEGLYIWSTGDWGPNIFSVTVSDSGTYWVNVTNDLGCSFRDMVHVGFHPKATFGEDNLIITPTACGGSSGSIAGLMVEGIEPLAFEWYDGDGNLVADTLDIYNLPVNNYYLHVLDDHGCETVSEAFTITDAGDVEISEVDYSPGHCGQEIGFIEITATTGSGTELMYSKDNGNSWQTSNQFADLPAGSYFIKVADQVGCEAVYAGNPVVIENIPGPEITSVSITPENDYLADGSIDIEAIIGSGDLYYSIDNGSSFQTNDGFFENRSAGTYPCVVKDDFGCDTSFIVVIDRILSQVIDAIAGDGYTCIGDATASQLLLNNFTEVDSFYVQLTYDPAVIQCDGYIQVHPDLESGLQASLIPALGQVHITWKGEMPVTLPANAKMLELVFSGLEEGVSQIDWIADPGEGQFFNAYGEEIPVQYELGTIRIFTRPEIILGTELHVCEGDNIYLPAFVLGGTGEYEYYWTGPSNFSSTDKELKITGIQAYQAGDYQLTVTDTIDCTSQKSIELIVSENPVAAFHGTDTLEMVAGDVLDAGEGMASYRWSPGDTTQSIVIQESGMYSVEMGSQIGCVGTDSVYVKLVSEEIPEFTIYIPNAFSPNGDGINDSFQIKFPNSTFNIQHSTLSIFNRWGEEIFESTDITQGWDGKKNGNPCPGGVYVYKIVFSVDGVEGNQERVGTVMLVR
ncbi:MAG: gliding motility-associated C-terminal domain-containing protein [Bacteroidales bacterium]|jgi:gliding motility-associated-like protein|nr:gliding motility-associated C-terminal domain-containing protein [Bacteroidales bacterium]